MFEHLVLIGLKFMRVGERETGREFQFLEAIEINVLGKNWFGTSPI